jgi:regulator of PEP synthase PpsR (kinase-PPPase family)
MMIRSFLAILLYINIARAFLLQPLLEKKSIRRTQVFSSRELDDAELIRQILGPLGVKRPRTKPRVIMILSDGTGLTAKSAIEKTTAFQFNGCDERFSSVTLVGKENNEDEACEFMQTKNYPFIQSAKEVEDILEQTHKFNMLIVFTFADPKMRDLTTRLTKEADIPSVDLLGPMFNSMTTFFDRKPVGKAEPSKPPQTNSRRRVLSEDYYREIEAIEFTLHCDSGMSPHLLKDADVIIVGVSRTGKTPLSVVLSHTMGLKVANIPLVLGLDPPHQLFEPDIDPKRVFCLILDPNDLLRIRENRLSKGINSLRHSSESNYADPDYLREDIANAEKLAEDNNYTIVDVTGRAVEETSSFISAMLNQRFPGIV